MKALETETAGQGQGWPRPPSYHRGAWEELDCEGRRLAWALLYKGGSMSEAEPTEQELRAFAARTCATPRPEAAG
jgi:hypothetical protein